MTPERARLASFMFAIAWSQPLFLGNAAQPQPASIEIAFVANAEAGTVALFDVASRFILGTIDVNPAHAKREGPGKPNYAQDTDVSPDGRTLYVSRGYLGDVAAFDIPTARLLWQRPLNTGRADHMTLTPDGRIQLTIADVATGRILDSIRLDHAFRPWQFTPDERGLYAQLSNEHAVVAYDIAARKVVKRLDLPVKPGITAADWDFEAPHHGLALTPDGRTLCLAGRASDYAALARAPDLALIATIPVGDGPGWSETAEDGRMCLVADTRSDELSILSIPERRETARLPIGDGPKHITVARIPAPVVAAFKARP
jgi:DNA-binding beta-propeller fold protein YncE